MPDQDNIQCLWVVIRHDPNDSVLFLQAYLSFAAAEAAVAEDMRRGVNRTRKNYQVEALLACMD